MFVSVSRKNRCKISIPPETDMQFFLPKSRSCIPIKASSSSFTFCISVVVLSSSISIAAFPAKKKTVLVQKVIRYK